MSHDHEVNERCHNLIIIERGRLVVEETLPWINWSVVRWFWMRWYLWKSPEEADILFQLYLLLSHGLCLAIRSIFSMELAEGIHLCMVQHLSRSFDQRLATSEKHKRWNALMLLLYHEEVQRPTSDEVMNFAWMGGRRYTLAWILSTAASNYMLPKSIPDIYFDHHSWQNSVLMTTWIISIYIYKSIQKIKIKA